jgi:hypothetical protein
MELGAAFLATGRQRVALRGGADHNPRDPVLVERVRRHPAGEGQHGHTQCTSSKHAEHPDANELMRLVVRVPEWTPSR